MVSDEQTIGDFIEAEIPEKGDASLVSHNGDVFTVENVGTIDLVKTLGEDVEVES